MIRPLTALLRRDLRLFFVDRRAVLMCCLAPIAIASFFGYIFGGNGRTENPRIHIFVIDDDDSAISREIVARLSADAALDMKLSTLDEAREAVRKGTVSAAIAIPRDFGAATGQALFRGTEKPEIGLLYDPSHAAEKGMVQGMLTGPVMEAESKARVGGKSARDSARQSLVRIDQRGEWAP